MSGVGCFYIFSRKNLGKTWSGCLGGEFDVIGNLNQNEFV